MSFMFVVLVYRGFMRREISDKADLVERICTYVRSNLGSDLTLSYLEKRFHISRYHLQRVFMEVTGMTPGRWVEQCRINALRNHLKNGEPMPGAVYGNGYGSHNWLYEDHLSKLEMTHASYRKGGEGAEIRYMTSECSFGFILVAETDHGVCSVSIADGEKELENSIRMEFPKASLTRSESVRKTLDSVLSYLGGRMSDLPLDIDGTEFQKRVWAAILTIPYGETRSYSEVAVTLGEPRAHRAVANACAANPVPLIIPCHRVIRNSGDLGGYGPGVDRKKYLLELERADPQV